MTGYAIRAVSIIRNASAGLGAKKTVQRALSTKTVPEQTGQIEIKVEPIKRTGESEEVKRARLLYQSRKRGILEADLLLSRFAKKHLDKMTFADMTEYDSLLDEPDWDIYYWATENYEVTPLPEKWKNSKILKMLQEDSKNKEKEVIRMPDL